jgi:hypothetical protein
MGAIVSKITKAPFSAAGWRELSADIANDSAVAMAVDVQQSGTVWQELSAVIANDSAVAAAVQASTWQELSAVIANDSAVDVAMSVTSWQDLGASLSATSAVDVSIAPQVETIVLATDAYAESIANTSVLRGSNPITDPATGIQYFVYHADNLPSVLSGKVAVGKVTPDGTVTIDKSSVITNSQDSHNFFSLDVDGDGDLLMSGDMHGVPMKWQRLTGGSIHFTGWATPPIEATATDESSVTYPMFSVRLPNGNRLLGFRDGASGQANFVIKKWTAATNTLRTVGGLGAIIVDGESTESFYPHVPYYDEARGRLHMMGCWRVSSNLNTNHDQLHFWLESSDGWDTCVAKKADGSAQTLPVTRGNAAYAATGGVFAQNHGLTNVGTVTIDSSGNPRGFTFTDPGDGITQLVALRYTGSAWVTQWIPDDVQLQSAIPFSYVGVTGGAYRTISSPYAICDGTTNRTIIPMRSDTQGVGVWCLISERSDLTQWVWQRLNTEDLGNAWFGSKDAVQWRNNGVIDMLVQKSQLKDYGTEPDIGPQPIKRTRFRPAASYTYTAPPALWNPNTYPGCVAYVAPRGGVKSDGTLNGVKVTGGGNLSDVARVTELMDARDGTPFVVQASTTDAPNFVWNRYGTRKGGVQYVAANLDWAQGNDAPTLASFNGINVPMAIVMIVEFMNVTTAQRIWAMGDSAGSNLKYMGIGITAAGLPTFERRVGGAAVKQWTGNAALVAGTKYALAAVFDGSNGYMLVNNVQQVAAIDMGFATASTWTHYNLGCRNRSTARDLYLDGYHGAIVNYAGASIPSGANVQQACIDLAAEHGFSF